jgi:phosphatidylglycerophosphatase A
VNSPAYLVAKIFGTGFGTGYVPFASGTAGSALALAIYWFVPGFSAAPVLIGTTLLFLMFGIWASTQLEEEYGHDAKQITIDEFVGQWLTLWFVPVSLLHLLLAFLFFRFFDIAKPEPVNKLQKLPKGFGVMMDDVMAGIYANLLLQLVIRVVLPYFTTT